MSASPLHLHPDGVPERAEGPVYRPIVRLDEPCNPSTRLGERVQLRGWFIVPPGTSFTDERTRPTLEVLLEPLNAPHPLRDQSGVLGLRLSRARSVTEPYLEYLQFDARPQLLSLPPEVPSGDVYGISGAINIASLVPSQDAPAERFRISLLLGTSQWMSVSNTVEIAVLPHQLWYKPYGGFLFPPPGIVRAEVLAVDGWALSMGDTLDAVELFANDTALGTAHKGIWSPQIHLALPDPEESTRAIFTLALVRREVASLCRGKVDLAQPFTLRAECKFSSGETLRLETPRVRWLGEDRALAPAIRGALERIAAAEQGRIRLEGWCATRYGGRPRLYLEGLRKRVEVVNDVATGTTLIWSNRPDKETEHLSWATADLVGFSVEFDPLLLGRLTGSVQLLAETADGAYRLELGREQGERIAELVRQQVATESGVERAALRGAEMLGKLGVLKRPPRTRRLVPQAEGALRRVLVATHNLSAVEGAPKILWRVLDALRARHPDTAVTIVSPRGGGREAELREQGYEVEIIPELSMVGASFERYHRGLRRLSAVADACNPDFIYANVIDCFWGIDLALRRDLRSLWLIHESIDPLSAFPEVEARLRVQFLHRLRHAPAVVFVAESTRKLFADHLRSARVSVIPNGVDVETIEAALARQNRAEVRERLGIEPECTVISIIGTTTERKGQDVFLREMAILREQLTGRQVKFLIVGAREGHFLDVLHEIVRRKRLAEYVEFVAETPDVEPYFLASDVAVIASREESAPLVSLEAFAYGVPLVSTTVFGLGEQISDGVNALAFDLAEEGALAAAVRRVLEDDTLRTDLVTNAKRIVRERFSNRFIEDHVAAVHRAAGVHGAS